MTLILGTVVGLAVLWLAYLWLGLRPAHGGHHGSYDWERFGPITEEHDGYWSSPFPPVPPVPLTIVAVHDMLAQAGFAGIAANSVYGKMDVVSAYPSQRQLWVAMLAKFDRDMAALHDRIEAA